MIHPRSGLLLTRLLAAAIVLAVPVFQPALAREPNELVIGTSAASTSADLSIHRQGTS
jgi:hypothetical protein